MAKQSRHGPRRGNPYKPIDWDKVDQLIIQGCNGIQVAASIGVSADTLYDRCTLEKKTNFSAYFQEKRALGDAYLHQAQYQKAIKEKNAQMLIHLGEFRLGQVKGSTKQTQDILQGLSDIIEATQSPKPESDKTS